MQEDSPVLFCPLLSFFTSYFVLFHVLDSKSGLNLVVLPPAGDSCRNRATESDVSICSVGLQPSGVAEVLLSSRWFHGKITREQAERLLYPPETGLFLVRESTNYPGDYTLCVSCDGKVEHYRIIYHNGKLTIDEEEYFENLMQLVEVSRSTTLLHRRCCARRRASRGRWLLLPGSGYDTGHRHTPDLELHTCNTPVTASLGGQKG